jgi:triphosphatase
MQSANVEFELKLFARSEDLAALYDSPIITAHSCDRPSDRRLKTTYYDTTDQALRREGMALRVRHEGRTFVQTLKAVSFDGGPSRRREWEATLQGAGHFMHCEQPDTFAQLVLEFIH